MTSRTLPGERSGLRVILNALALIFLPLLADNRTPSGTQLDERLCADAVVADAVLAHAS